MFAERPEEAATVARDLLAARDAELIPFLYSFPWGMEPPEIGERLHSSDFPFALLDIALDDYWYTELNSAFQEEYIEAIPLYKVSYVLTRNVKY